MEPINVLVNDEIAEDALPRIESIDQRISATHIGRLLTAEMEGDTEARAHLDQLLDTAEVYAGIRIPHQLTRRAPRLKWVQITRAGVDKVLMDEEFRRSPIVVTNVAGMHSFGPAELVIQSCLAHVKGTLQCARQKEARRWEPFQTRVLKGKTMGIVGYGSIGRRVARVAKAFEMWVIATRRSTKAPGRAQFADIMLPTGQLNLLLSESDFVVLTTPLTPETYHLFGAVQFAAMRSDALLVNVSRGPIVDEAALVVALRERQIAAAALDVFETEPLPQESPLWDLPNLLYSPHIAGNVPAYPSMVQDLFIRNLARYVRGDKLQSVVNKRRGY